MTYGYEMKNGTVMINHSEAAVIKQIYKNYISGMSFSMSAKKAGLNIPHGSVKRLLLKKCYLGDDFYPAIIDIVHNLKRCGNSLNPSSENFSEKVSSKTPLIL